MMGSWCLCRRGDGRSRLSPGPGDGQKVAHRDGTCSAELKIFAQMEEEIEDKEKERVIGEAPASVKVTKGESQWEKKWEGGDHLTVQNSKEVVDFGPGTPAHAWSSTVRSLEAAAMAAS